MQEDKLLNKINAINFASEVKALAKNTELQQMVEKEMQSIGLNSSLKGFKYCSDIITLSLIKKKYSRTTIAELIPFIAYKYGIKEYSVQRQMRYTCTVVTKNKYTAIEVVYYVWNKVNQKIQSERERYVK